MKKKPLKIVKSTKDLPKDLTTLKATDTQQPLTHKIAPQNQQQSPTHTPAPTTTQKIRDPRIPPAGTIITRKYKGQTLQVKVVEIGFEYNGTTYKSISAVAVHITQMPTSGYVFFKLNQPHKNL